MELAVLLAGEARGGGCVVFGDVATRRVMMMGMSILEKKCGREERRREERRGEEWAGYFVSSAMSETFTKRWVAMLALGSGR